MDSPQERIQNLESLLDVYGAALWQGLCEAFPEEEARAVWTAVILAACRMPLRALTPKRAKRSLTWIVGRQAREALARRGLGWRARLHWRQALEQTLSARSDAVLPAQLRAETLRLIPAGVAAADAERRYRGPRWVTGLAATVAITGAGVTAAGALPHWWHHPVPRRQDSTPAADLPAPLANLPVRTVAQFRLADARDTVLNQVYAGDDGVYRVQWQVEPGAVTVRVDGCPYRKDGEALQWRAVALATFTPPGSSLLPGGITAGETWTANVENADVSGSWLVCCVEWSRNTKATAQRVAAVYGVHLPTGHAGLMTAWTVRPGHVDAYHVAIGAGKVAVQAEIRNQAGKQPPVGLPVQVYDLQGSDPATALHPSDTVPAPFGVMANPMVTGHGVVFQGIEGHSDPGDTVNATWYLAPFEGEASELLGPPQDGQPHWVVEAADGKLWWAETTPSDNGRFQVLMGPLVPMGQSPTVPAYTLDGTVEAFRADGRWVMWVQTDGQTQQLVVSEVQGGGT